MSRRVVDYAFKSYVLKEHNDLLQRCKRSKWVDFKNSNQDSFNELYFECVKNDLHKEFLESVKINNANYKRVQRLRYRVSDMLLNGACLFLTLTFNDDTLANTSEKERRVAVSRFLKQYHCSYVANIDFGANNHREHYHALINTDRVKYSDWHKYGSIKGEKVQNRNIKEDMTKLSKYICKLSNHAIKETTRRSSLMYSR